MVHRLGNPDRRASMVQFKLTSLVVTHDTRLAAKLADHMSLPGQGKALFFAQPRKWSFHSEPHIQEFLGDDRAGFSGCGHLEDARGAL